MTSITLKDLINAVSFAIVVSAVVLTILWFTDFMVVRDIKKRGEFMSFALMVYVYYAVMAVFWQAAKRENLWDFSARLFSFLVFAAFPPLAYLIYQFVLTENISGLAILLNMFLIVPWVAAILVLIPYVVISGCRALRRLVTPK